MTNIEVYGLVGAIVATVFGGIGTRWGSRENDFQQVRILPEVSEPEALETAANSSER